MKGIRKRLSNDLVRVSEALPDKGQEELRVREHFYIGS